VAQRCDRFDTVVVGAGIAGAWLARCLADQGERVAVLEARRAAGGNSTPGAYVALIGTPELYAHLRDRVGEAQAREIWDLTRENLSLLEQQLTDAGLCQNSAGSLRVSDRYDGTDGLKRSVDALTEAGIGVELKDAAPYGYAQGLATQGDLVFRPAALAQSLLAHEGITQVFEAQVHEIRPAGSEVSVWAHKHSLRSERVVLANGVHAIHLSRAMSAFLHPVYTHAVDIEMSRTLEAPLIIDEGQTSVLQDADKWRLCGWSERGHEVLGRLAVVASQFQPQAIVSARKTQWVAQSTDSLPVVGKVPDLPETYTINGLGVWGLSWVGIAAERLLSRITHNTSAGILDIERFSQL